MPPQVNKEEFISRKEEFFAKIRDGATFIHPTDTIYGIGCDATNQQAVEKIRELKQRPTAPFSVIAPSKEWIRKNCEFNSETESWLEKLPGPYTLIFKLKQGHSLAESVRQGMTTCGIRMPDHWMLSVAQEMNIPIVSTSANISGQPFMTTLDDGDKSILEGVDFIIYEGEKKGRPSTVVNLTGPHVLVLKR
jgi:L-threonylcarbamoyladenylate synthase